MRRIAFPLLLIVLFLAVPAHAWVDPLGLVISPLPSPGDVVKLLDVLTKKDSPTSVDVRLKRTIAQGKLLVARARVDVALERSSRNWRGRVLVRMTVPSEISYSIDLADIRPEHIQLDAKNKQLRIVMPAPRVEDVTPILEAVRADNTYRAGRFRLFDATVSQELQNAMLKQDYLARAREAGARQLPTVREQGRGVLQEFLQKLLEGPCPEVHVVIE